MLYLLLYPLHTDISWLNIFRYVTFRSAYAAVTAFLIAFLLGPPLIRLLKRKMVEEIIREEVPERHQAKAGTPSMGGILILAGVLVPTLLWADITSRYVIVALVATASMGLMGFVDDYLKLISKKPLGLLARWKFVGQSILALAIGLFVYLFPLENGMTTWLTFPFIKDVAIDLGVWYVLFVMITVVGSTNAVNLADGLDGLAAGAMLFSGAAYAVMCYIVGNVKFAEYLNVMFVSGGGELTVYMAAMIGALLGFLWFNSYPAQVFMGDTGALALGGGIGTVAVLIKQELLLVIVGGAFVIETLSVMSQVAYFKITGGKRLFKMAPIHHHYELRGVAEPKITIRFWILSAICAVIGLSTLKIR
ncbi:MAG: phospho-N-acetylmuramoyl-pentapeptide-transferase [Candidatus Zixiibacteriota bacterium]